MDKKAIIAHGIKVDKRISDTFNCIFIRRNMILAIIMPISTKHLTTIAQYACAPNRKNI